MGDAYEACPRRAAHRSTFSTPCPVVTRTVNTVHYFSSVRGFEAAGLPTRFPHPSGLYETLLSKDWQPSLCLTPRLRIPPTTTVSRAAVVCDPRRAASAAIEALDMVRAMRYDGTVP